MEVEGMGVRKGENGMGGEVPDREREVGQLVIHHVQTH